MSTFNYKTYCAFMRGKRQEPMSEAQFNEMEGISTDIPILPLHIRPRNQRAVKPTMENHKKVEG